MKTLIAAIFVFIGAANAFADSAPAWNCNAQDMTLSMSKPYVGESAQDYYMQTLVTIALEQYRVLYFLDPIERAANDAFDNYPSFNENDVVFEGANNKAGSFKLVLTNIVDKSTDTYTNMSATGLLSLTSSLGHVQSYELFCELK